MDLPKSCPQCGDICQIEKVESYKGMVTKKEGYYDCGITLTMEFYHVTGMVRREYNGSCINSIEKIREWAGT